METQMTRAVKRALLITPLKEKQNDQVAVICGYSVILNGNQLSLRFRT